MNTSKEYIDMCRKAVEIQEAWKPTEGDLVWHNADHRKESGDIRQFCQSLHILINGDRAEGRCPKMLHCSILGIFNLEDVKKPGPKHIIWLPKQDQLQEMISSEWYKIWNIQSHFMKFAGGEYPFYPYCSLSHFHSMEQLWLAFIMKEKFNKYWDGKNWDNYEK